ncbi:MAG: trigger factor [Candidatus Marinimicrobia bacterium]|nr:trigger factor [Candidatus Neomarinimicrobiota bacterium]
MQCDVSVINDYTRQLAVAVPWVELEGKYTAFLRKFTKKVKLPGFRKGKVPPQIIRRQFGPVAEADFAESAVQEYYVAGLDESGLAPINQATIREVHFHEGESLRFEATFEVEPEVVLPNYTKGLKFQQIIFDIEDEDVVQAVEDLRRQQATLKTVDDGAAEDHFIMADLQEVDEAGTPLIGRKVENQYIQLTADGPFGGENLQRLQGARSGDTRRVAIPSETGPPTNYELTVKQVTERILPDLDDAFAKQVDPQADDFEQLRRNLRQRIQASFEKDAERRLTREIADHFVRGANLEAPASMFENYLENVISEIQRDGIRLEEIDREAVRDEHRASINWNIKWFLLRARLLKEEEISVDDDALKQRIDELAAVNGQESQRVRDFYRRPENRRNLKEELLTSRLMARLKEYAKIKVVHKSSNELRKVGGK